LQQTENRLLHIKHYNTKEKINFKLEVVETKAEGTSKEKLKTTKRETRDGNASFHNLMMILTI